MGVKKIYWVGECCSSVLEGCPARGALRGRHLFCLLFAGEGVQTAVHLAFRENRIGLREL